MHLREKTNCLAHHWMVDGGAPCYCIASPSLNSAAHIDITDIALLMSISDLDQTVSRQNQNGAEARSGTNQDCRFVESSQAHARMQQMHASMHRHAAMDSPKRTQGRACARTRSRPRSRHAHAQYTHTHTHARTHVHLHCSNNSVARMEEAFMLSTISRLAWNKNSSHVFNPSVFNVPAVGTSRDHLWRCTGFDCYYLAHLGAGWVTLSQRA